MCPSFGPAVSGRLRHRGFRGGQSMGPFAPALERGRALLSVGVGTVCRSFFHGFPFVADTPASAVRPHRRLFPFRDIGKSASPLLRRHRSAGSAASRTVRSGPCRRFSGGSVVRFRHAGCGPWGSDPTGKQWVATGPKWPRDSGASRLRKPPKMLALAAVFSSGASTRNGGIPTDTPAGTRRDGTIPAFPRKASAGHEFHRPR